MKRLFIVRHEHSPKEVAPTLIVPCRHGSGCPRAWTVDRRSTGTRRTVVRQPCLAHTSTAQCLVDVWEEPSSHIQFEEQAYLPPTALGLDINAWPDAHDNGWIVRHNPGRANWWNG